MNDSVLKYAIALSKLKGVGAIKAKNLMAHAGGYEQVFNLSVNDLNKIPGVGTLSAKTIHNQFNCKQLFEEVNKELKFIEKNNITPYIFKEENYPINLAQCEDGPIVLYSTGNIDFNKTKILSVVGTRKITEYGKDVCKQLLEGFTNDDVLVVSGLAYGVDSFTHQMCVDSGIQTVGVLAHGLDRIYPATNKSLATKMCNNGGLVTEFMSGTNPDRENFPKRNRIIAGLADATLVIESAKKGGSLITAEIANSYSRDVFAVPGKIGDVYSEGCNYLIKTNKAHLVNSVADINYIMNWDVNKKKSKPVQKKIFLDLSEDENKIKKVFETNELLSIDSINAQTDLSISTVAITLLELEFKGAVKSLPGKIYKWS
jgi:DNA processing protein